ncbi:L-threonylcarbamoyladenylate synthase [Desulfurobacterium atlanticum]|uniref:L-threonylcarbamoyladenylate synthase n=1 Tax=Desulfurobacterium atlanticum TaxID=240169 RepID=A0A238Z631_9BACT|nr:L-threonylcarbamoyladenylate synthase [Desulfurobacterium atlanticum]SNR78499.1 L-threonylcarbamoyladenylate synthase [Desulfurobacterium atlanticum]
MKILDFEKDFETIKCLICGGEIICSPTDTQFGLIGNALDIDAIKKVYQIKRRDSEKPLIVLFDSISRIRKYGVIIPNRYEGFLNKIWPERLTVILPLEENSPFKLLFNRNNIAVRIPKHEKLRKLIKETVPVFAPSANIQNEKPATTCEECKKHFENLISYCIKGKCNSIPSTIISLTSNSIKLIREGVILFSTVEKLIREI